MAFLLASLIFLRCSLIERSGFVHAPSKHRLIDLNHKIEPGMTTYKGLPGPTVCDYWSRDESATRYADGARFQIGKIEMVSNTGTYVDAPFHLFDDGADIAGLALESLAELPGLMVHAPFASGLAVGPEAFAGREVRGCAVLVHTGWDALWRTEAYQSDHPYLTEDAAILLRDAGAALVGIDSHNIDDTRPPVRPVHRVLLTAGIPVCEHLTGLGALPDAGFTFSAVPPRFVGVGTFPVRAYARLA
jgi:arylformamidase